MQIRDICVGLSHSVKMSDQPHFFLWRLETLLHAREGYSGVLWRPARPRSLLLWTCFAVGLFHVECVFELNFIIKVHT